MKKYTVTVIEDDEGTVSMERQNDGFSLIELFGFLHIIRLEFEEMLKGHIKVDQIKRTSIVD